jgi:hypothetical protein
VIRTWTVLVLLATGLATQAADAAVIQGTRPPSRADRKGLVRAFDALHRNRSHLRLVGFRVWENKPAGAAYSLTTDAQGKYVAGHTDLFRRLSGHRWKHTSHFKNENPLFNWASTLHPGYLYRATSDGTGAYDEQSTSSYDDGSGTTSDHLHADFRWHFDIDHGRACLPSRDNFFYAPGLTGTLSYTLTGSVHFRLVGMLMPLGLLSYPSPPVRADGRVPPVQR